jgi:hypothetical protein
MLGYRWRIIKMNAEEVPLQKECDLIQQVLNKALVENISGDALLAQLLYLTSELIGKLQAGVNRKNIIRQEAEKIYKEFSTYAEIALRKSESYGNFWGKNKRFSYNPSEEIEVRKLLKEIDSGNAEEILAKAKIRQLLSFMNTKFQILKKIYNVTLTEDSEEK